MNYFKNMWDFPVKEGVTFENANRVHPLVQRQVQELRELLSQDENVMRLILFGSSLEFHCSSGSDIDLYIEKRDPEKKLKWFPESDRKVDVIMDLQPASALYQEIEEKGLLLFERR